MIVVDRLQACRTSASKTGPELAWPLSRKTGRCLAEFGVSIISLYELVRGKLHMRTSLFSFLYTVQFLLNALYYFSNGPAYERYKFITIISEYDIFI
jgi:hypothetical protein